MNKKFDNPKWNQDPGAKLTNETFKITEETKKWSEEQDRKWKETLKKLKQSKNSTK
jgi:hypothetical protein|nr:MAG TPA: hypothetical protein [Caudoviricetes sp.]